MKKNAILLVEDNIDLQIEMRDFLAHQGLLVHVATDLQQMQEKLSQTPINALLLDLGLPDGDGLAAIAPIRQRYGLALGIVVVSARGADVDRVTAIAAGADFFMVKPVCLEELQQVILRLCQRLPQDGLASWRFDKSQSALVSPDNKCIALTGTEYRFLRLLATQSQPIPREHLIKALYQRDHVVETRCLDTLVSRLRKKIREHSAHELMIQSHRNLGYSIGGELCEPDNA